MRIIILTKDLYRDIVLQNQLQQLNYEVLISESLYWQLVNRVSIDRDLSHFQWIIFSPTLSDEEISRIIDLIPAKYPLIRQVPLKSAGGKQGVASRVVLWEQGASDQEVLKLLQGK